jgi:hypothetical protein
MVVPPGPHSYMASSMWGSGHIPSNSRPSAPPLNSGTAAAGVRARANRVQNMTNRTVPAHHPQSGAQTAPKHADNGLESSWWGNTSAASQVLASSVISVGSRSGAVGLEGGSTGGESATTKQLMRLMDSLKTLGDENTNLLREVEEAEAARTEAKATRDQMKRFKAEYGKRFAALKAALEKFRKEHPESTNGNSNINPVNTRYVLGGYISCYHRCHFILSSLQFLTVLLTTEQRVCSFCICIGPATTAGTVNSKTDLRPEKGKGGEQEERRGSSQVREFLSRGESTQRTKGSPAPRGNPSTPAISSIPGSSLN